MIKVIIEADCMVTGKPDIVLFTTDNMHDAIDYKPSALVLLWYKLKGYKTMAIWPEGWIDTPQGYVPFASRKI